MFLAEPGSGVGLGNLSLMLEPILRAANDRAGLFVPYGKGLLAFAFTCEMMMTLFQFWIKGGANDLIAKLFRLFIVTALPLAVLESWPYFPVLIADFFEKELAHLLTSTDGSVFDHVRASIEDMYKAAWGMGELANAANPSEDGMVARAMSHLIVYIVLYLPLMFVSLAMLFGLYGPMLMIGLGIVFGPILVAWLPLEAMSNLATKWLNYMITMGMAFIVGITMSAILTSGLKEFHTVIEAQQGTLDASGAALAGLIPTLVAVLFIGYMMFKIETIAAAMVGGPQIGGGSGFMGAMAGLAMRSGGKNSSGKSQAAPKGDAGGSGGTGGGGGGTGGGGGGTAGAGGAGAGGSSTQAGLSSQAGSVASSATPGTPASKPTTGAGVGKASSSWPGSGSGSGGGGGGGGAGAGSPSSSTASAPEGNGVVSSAPAGSGSKLGNAMRAGGQAAASYAKSGQLGKDLKSSKVLNNGGVKAGAVAAAAVVAGPVGAIAMGAYAVSPAARSAVNKGVSKVAAKFSGAKTTPGKTGK